MPNKVLGTVPVPSHMLAVPTITMPLMASPRTGQPRGTIVFEVAKWAEVRRDSSVPDSDVSLGTGFGLIREGGIALKHEGVTLETLRRIPGFIEAKP